MDADLFGTFVEGLVAMRSDASSDALHDMAAAKLSAGMLTPRREVKGQVDDRSSSSSLSPPLLRKSQLMHTGAPADNVFDIR